VLLIQHLGKCDELLITSHIYYT